MVAVDAEAFEVEDAEGLHHGLRAGDFVKVIVGNLGHSATVAQRGEEFIELGGIRMAFPIRGGVFWHDDLARVDTLKGREQILGACVGGDNKFARGQVEPSGVQLLLL